MILKNSTFSEFSDHVKSEKKKIIVYGAGMIGKVIVPYYIQKYELSGNVICYLDIDKRKQEEKIIIGSCEFTVESPEMLRNINQDVVLLITNSKFYSVIDFLDNIPNLDNSEGYIAPLMRLEEPNRREMIPKVIHYCWFGKKEIPDFLRKCMCTWRMYCPDYDIVEWNEDNYDINKVSYMKEAYEQKKFGFVTDVARLDILYQHGGIYMDTDVKLLRSIDDLLCQPGFVASEKWGNINSGGMIGAVPEHPMIKEMLEFRSGFHFSTEDGGLNTETNGLYETIPFLRKGYKIENMIQYINGMTVYPSEFFHPYDYLSCQADYTKNTYSEHCFYGSWMDDGDKDTRMKTQKRYRSILRRIEQEGKSRI